MKNDFILINILRINHHVNRFFLLLTKIYTLSLARLVGIIIKGNIKCFGRIYFHRTPGSKIKIGENCEFRSKWNSNFIGINHSCIISTHTKFAEIHIGDNCGFSGVTIGCQQYIEIGSNVLVGANVIITDTDWHSLNPEQRLTGKPKSKPVIIKNNVFIGVNSIILKGSYIGENVIIGAGSVVSGSIPDNVIAAGNPCKVLRVI